MTTVLTYGTFDLFHVAHLSMLERLASLGDRLVVGVSTDEFNLGKGKRSVFGYEQRARIVSALRCVDNVFPEESWEQKKGDVNRLNVDIFGIGEDWTGKFDYLNEVCRVVYLPRTENISTTELKRSLSKLDSDTIRRIKDSLDDISNLIRTIE